MSNEMLCLESTEKIVLELAFLIDAEFMLTYNLCPGELDDFDWNDGEVLRECGDDRKTIIKGICRGVNLTLENLNSPERCALGMVESRLRPLLNIAEVN